MVIFKVTDGSQTRKFEVPSLITYSALKNKLSSAFPDSVNEDSDLVLHYRDSEGDVITLSSDLELQELLSTTQQTVLKFEVPRKKTSRTGSVRHHHSWMLPGSFIKANPFEEDFGEFASLLDILRGPNKTSCGTRSANQESASEDRESTSPDDNDSPSAPEEPENEEVRSKPTPKSTSEDDNDTAKTESVSKPAAERRCGYTVFGNFAPLFLSDVLLHSYPTRRVYYPRRWTPYGFNCYC